MEETTVMDRLGEKVSRVLQKYHELRGENEMLRNEINGLREANEAYAEQVSRLENDIAAKDREIDEIVNKIESILG
ncbi:MAG: hypothetical protein B5M52_00245 [Helicobacteraceae bacterium 4484_230]|jgi:SMC interacting uncharacterized protein involved in chromosome segregation|nr:MAG: hypothetical protein B5M52_00245 [Helicobacteraceae bacterium 4484_230]